MSRPANPARGEAAIVVNGEALVLRPTFEALVAAEEELGALFALVERAAAGGLKLGEIATLFWHCVADRGESCTRTGIGDAIVEGGLARATPALKVLLTQILQGRV
ncbi:gene transfer agent family protein [Sphingosinicella sp. LHD-64]|uniref:gene transfer agent family protein n=1 Tax=Sphingosinicella sp. LHD-64 TaxID=3072139 RepID=UPI00280F9792|nr:gene transfer agent family protein [Sphingosinicella sp. LHD-64]MDQ8757848.1 gene transfer agent family protein [Sphingosinicella sp. LHD-64]